MEYCGRQCRFAVKHGNHTKIRNAESRERPWYYLTTVCNDAGSVSREPTLEGRQFQLVV